MLHRRLVRQQPLPALLLADLPNYFDCDEGYVPDGFGNSVGDPSCEIVSDGVEFAYEGHSNRFTVDLDPTGLITLTGEAAGELCCRPAAVSVMPLGQARLPWYCGLGFLGVC
jgi:hypothetical protein